ncbi:MAG: hypothetical protein RLZZ203_2615 [Cyanobacteriota bacterium]|jgi:L-histidine N-alpha-methyltransferase
MKILKYPQVLNSSFDPIISFMSDVKSLFLHQQEENMGSYLYSTPDPSIKGDTVNGEEYYREIINQSQDYYLYQEEMQLIHQVAHKMAVHVPKEANIIEFGTGTETSVINKTLPFLKAIKQVQNYIPIDLCKTYLHQTEEIVTRELPEILIKPLEEDFIKNVDLVKNFSTPVVFFKGSTITNLSPSICIDFLERISQALQPEGILIVGVDANQNESSLRKAYNTEGGAKFALNIFHLINRELPITNFNPTAFKYDFEWVLGEHCVKHNAISTQAQNFVLDQVSINIKPGEKFHLFSSYKYPIEYFQTIAKKGGLEPLDCFIHENKRMVIHVLKPQQLHK